MSQDLERALAVLVEEIHARRWDKDADLMKHCVEILELMRARVASLAEQNRDLRAIVARLTGKPLPKGYLTGGPNMTEPPQVSIIK
jgi:hypothetical protein